MAPNVKCGKMTDDKIQTDCRLQFPCIIYPLCVDWLWGVLGELAKCIQSGCLREDIIILKGSDCRMYGVHPRKGDHPIDGDHFLMKAQDSLI